MSRQMDPKNQIKENVKSLKRKKEKRHDFHAPKLN